MRAKRWGGGGGLGARRSRELGRGAERRNSAGHSARHELGRPGQSLVLRLGSHLPTGGTGRDGAQVAPACAGGGGWARPGPAHPKHTGPVPSPAAGGLGRRYCRLPLQDCVSAPRPSTRIHSSQHCPPVAHLLALKQRTRAATTSAPVSIIRLACSLPPPHHRRRPVPELPASCGCQRHAPGVVCCVAPRPSPRPAPPPCPFPPSYICRRL